MSHHTKISNSRYYFICASIFGALALAFPASAATVLRSSQPITDAQNNVWTVKRGVIYENGAKAGFSAQVVLLINYNGVIYQENKPGGWWLWNGSGWTPTTDPRVVTSSASCTDASGGVHASGSTYNVTLSTTVGSIPATAAQCPNGGTQPTKTVVTQSYSCANGTATAQGSSTSRTTNNGSPTCAVVTSGTAIPPASQIVDAHNNVWTVKSGVIYENGAKAGFSAQVVLLINYNGVIYQENAPGGWWSWNGSGWTATTDPRAVPPASCTDASGAVHASGTTYNVILSTTSGSIPATVAQCPNGGTQPTKTVVAQSYSCTNGTATAQGASTSTTTNNGSPTCVVAANGVCGAAMGTCTAGNPINITNLSGSPTWTCQGSNTSASCPPSPSFGFYGVNGHYDYPLTPADTLSILKEIGITNYRVNTGTDSSTWNPVVALAQTLIPAGIEVLPVIDVQSMGTPGNEASAYNAAFTLGAQVAQAFKGTGVAVYEAGNEADRDSSVFAYPSYAGNQTEDYLNSGWPNYRGTIRGLIAGIKSVQPSALVGVDFCGADVAASDMLWNGTQPDGSTGHPVVRWDITMWHVYAIYGDMTNMGVDGGGFANPPLNIFSYAQQAYGKPVWVTEWNEAPENTSAQKAAFLTSRLGEWYGVMRTYNVGSVMWYELLDYPTWGLLNDSTQTDISTAYTNFIAAHPAP